MIKEKVKGIRDWSIDIFLNSNNREDVEEILDTLIDTGCSGDVLREAFLNITSNVQNKGLLYSNPYIRKSVMVISKSVSIEEFFNTVIHEIVHYAVHICQADNIALDTETLCYIAGDVAQQILPKISKYICTCGKCKKKYS